MKYLPNGLTLNRSISKGGQIAWQTSFIVLLVKTKNIQVIHVSMSLKDLNRLEWILLRYLGFLSLHTCSRSWSLSCATPKTVSWTTLISNHLEDINLDNQQRLKWVSRNSEPHLSSSTRGIIKTMLVRYLKNGARSRSLNLVSHERFAARFLRDEAKPMCWTDEKNTCVERHLFWAWD